MNDVHSGGRIDGNGGDVDRRIGGWSDDVAGHMLLEVSLSLLVYFRSLIVLLLCWKGRFHE